MKRRSFKFGLLLLDYWSIEVTHHVLLAILFLPPPLTRHDYCLQFAPSSLTIQFYEPSSLLKISKLFRLSCDPLTYSWMCSIVMGQFRIRLTSLSERTNWKISCQDNYWYASYTSNQDREIRVLFCACHMHNMMAFVNLLSTKISEPPTLATNFPGHHLPADLLPRIMLLILLMWKSSGEIDQKDHQ